MAHLLTFLLLAAATASQTVPAFEISKSTNANVVVYSLHVDDACRPVGASPLTASWRMANGRTDRLDGLENRIYGVRTQRVEPDGRVTATMRSLPGRPVTIVSRRTPAGCAADTIVDIAGRRARLETAHLKLRNPFQVDALQVTGRALDDGATVREAIRR